MGMILVEGQCCVGRCSPRSQVNVVFLQQGEPGKAGEKGLVGRQGLRVSPS